MKNQLLPAKLKELRKAHGYTQDYVASALEIVRQTYSHYETGQRTQAPKHSLNWQDYITYLLMT